MKLLYAFMLFFMVSNSQAKELIQIEALDGKVSMLAPEDLGPMPTELLEMKYPSSNRPTEALSDETGWVSLAFHHTNDPLQPSQIPKTQKVLSQAFHQMYPTATWVRDETIEQNGKTFLVLELITPTPEEGIEVHNIIYGTSVDGRFLLVAFNTSNELADEWLPIGKKVMSSLSIK